MSTYLIEGSLQLRGVGTADNFKYHLNSVHLYQLLTFWIISAMSDRNSAPTNRRGSQISCTGSEIFRPPPPNYDAIESPAKETVIPKISGKFWGRVRKFLLCKTNFPSSIYYIVGNEFCERFSYYGMKAILIMFLTGMLDYKDSTATAIFHSFSMLCYLTPLLGAMLADGWLGKYRLV